MQPNSTHKICDNFGHNFYREKKTVDSSDIIKCKHCEITLKMNSNGDYEEMSQTNNLVHSLMKKLFLLRKRSEDHQSQHIYNL